MKDELLAKQMVWDWVDKLADWMAFAEVDLKGLL